MRLLAYGILVGLASVALGCAAPGEEDAEASEAAADAVVGDAETRDVPAIGTSLTACRSRGDGSSACRSAPGP